MTTYRYLLFVLAYTAVQIGATHQAEASLQAFVSADSPSELDLPASESPNPLSPHETPRHEPRVPIQVRGSRPRKKKRGNSGEEDWNARYRRTQKEIDEIYKQYAAKMQKLQGAPAAAVYIRYSTRDQDSAAAQARQLLEHALNKGVYVSRDMIFLDLAVRGSKKVRAGFDAATLALQNGDAKTLLVFTTSRLFRKLSRALVFVDKAVKEWRSRIIFVKNGIDTSDPNFSSLHYQVLAMLDEHSSQMYRDNIRAEHIAMHEEELICGTETFGYTGKPVSGRKTKRGRPRRRWIIDENAAGYVRKIFLWFVQDEENIEEIVRRLNSDSEAPLPPKCKEGWTRLAVGTVLKNPRYLGIFRYGDEENVDLPSKDYTAQRQRDEPLSLKHVERLCIVEDGMWVSATSAAC